MNEIFRTARIIFIVGGAALHIPPEVSPLCTTSRIFQSFQDILVEIDTLISTQLNVWSSKERFIKCFALI